jgi:hypothetical protein
MEAENLIHETKSTDLCLSSDFKDDQQSEIHKFSDIITYNTNNLLNHEELVVCDNNIEHTRNVSNNISKEKEVLKETEVITTSSTSNCDIKLNDKNEDDEPFDNNSEQESRCLDLSSKQIIKKRPVIPKLNLNMNQSSSIVFNSVAKRKRANSENINNNQITNTSFVQRNKETQKLESFINGTQKKPIRSSSACSSRTSKTRNINSSVGQNGIASIESSRVDISSSVQELTTREKISRIFTALQSKPNKNNTRPSSAPSTRNTKDTSYLSSIIEIKTDIENQGMRVMTDGPNLNLYNLNQFNNKQKNNTYQSQIH